MLFTLYSNSRKIGDECYQHMLARYRFVQLATCPRCTYLHAVANMPFFVHHHSIYNSKVLVFCTHNVEVFQAWDCCHAAECVCMKERVNGDRAKTTEWCLFGLLHFKFRFWIIYGSVYILVATLFVSVHRMASAAPSKWIRMEKLLTSELFIQINLNDGE